MARGTFTLVEPNGEQNGERRNEPRCILSLPMALTLILLAVLICVGVVLLVYFTTRASKSCDVQSTDSLSQRGENGIWWNDKVCLDICIEEGICVKKNGTKNPQTKTENPTKSGTAKVKDVRLPTSLVPISYIVEMKPDIYQSDPEDFTNTGTVSVLMDCVETTQKVTIHAKSLTVLNYELKEEGGTDIDMPNAPVYDKDRDFVYFILASPLTKGKQYRLILEYSGALKNDLRGIFYGVYNATNEVTGLSERRYTVSTQFQSTHTRKAFPCFDEPALKANFTISLWRKTGYTALSNMPLVDSETSTDGVWIKDSFQETVKMSTYLLAMVVCDFSYKEVTTSSGTKIRVWGRKAAINAGEADYALDQGKILLPFFEEFFDEKYPLPKLDMVAVPDFGGYAMENWGLVIYRDIALFYNSLVSSADNKKLVARIVSHEISHQWFGNLVTPTWWDDLWLNEGFATYLEYVGMNHTEPSWQAMEQFVTIDVQNTLKADSIASSHPIYVPVQHPSEIGDIFDAISYGKGGSLIRMIRYFLGDSTFKAALSRYFNTKAYGVAHHTDLWKAMQDEVDIAEIKDDMGRPLDVAGILDTWLLQMGYPLLDVQSNPSTGNGKDLLTIKQSHFLQDDSQEPDPKYPSPFGYKWDVPVSYVTDKDLNFDVNETSIIWFLKGESSKDIVVDSNADWLIVNPKQYGFYRVNYPEAYWQKLIDTLKSDHEALDKLNRAQVIDDSFNLALAGKLRITYAMEMTKYLTAEEDYIPWSAAITSLTYIGAALEKSEDYGNFKRYISTLLTPYYSKFNASWIVNIDGPIIEQFRQTEAIEQACKYDIADCRTKSQELFSQWMVSGSNTIPSNLRPTVYCYVLKEGGADEWEFLFDQFKTESNPSEWEKLLDSLGCTSELWLLQRLLDYSVDDTKIKIQDSYLAVKSATGSVLGRYLAWDWLRGKWDDIYEEYGARIPLIGHFVKVITSNFFTQFEYEQMERFAAEKGDLGTATQNFKQAKEKALINVKNLQRIHEPLSDWLKQTVPGA